MDVLISRLEAMAKTAEETMKNRVYCGMPMSYQYESGKYQGLRLALAMIREHLKETFDGEGKNQNDPVRG